MIVDVHLTKLPSPAYWSRWSVGDIGTVEKRGGFALWTALNKDGQIVATMCSTRVEAVRALTTESDA